MIIKSILDTDLYKFTTSYAYMKLFPQARGTFEFIDRDNTEYPEDFIERLYLELGVDPTTKTIVFSNALDFDKCQDIMEYCRGRIKCSFGIGTNGILSELIKVINSNKPYFIAYGPKGSSDMCIYPGSLNLTSEVITVGGIANARNSIFKLMKSNLISSNVSEECVTDKEFINFNDTY